MVKSLTLILRSHNHRNSNNLYIKCFITITVHSVQQVILLPILNVYFLLIFISNTSKYFQIRKKHNINHNYINQSSSFCIQRYYNLYCYCCFGLGDKNLQTSGMERDWPEGRGIFHNKAGVCRVT